jgi:hypothetical protein
MLKDIIRQVHQRPLDFDVLVISYPDRILKVAMYPCISIRTTNRFVLLLVAISNRILLIDSSTKPAAEHIPT